MKNTGSFKSDIGDLQFMGNLQLLEFSRILAIVYISFRDFLDIFNFEGQPLGF